ncbi:MAG: DNA gyrase subunit A [Clostridia bacterium]|nr:DNA gyrase subunit A [Clostridia bacterium]
MEHKDISYQNQKIVDIPMEKRVKTAFIEYAMSVIVARALPDVRDGLKPVHRRILYAMYEDKLTFDRPFCKSATTVGNVLGRYHPHGDAAVYDSMVRLAQPFNMRYTLIEGHGNFGNVDGDGAAAYRYTEARMSKIANAMLTDIEKEVVPFSPNFDNRLREPDVLPARFPNLLVNGSVGIAVGMATNVPPHNLGEVIDGTLHLIKNPDATVADLMTFIKGPDFPTNGIICGTSGIYNAYRTGRGRIIVRARATVEEDKRRIVITEIPYQVNKSMLVESMANLVKDKKIEGITDIRDESGKAGMKIVVDFRRDANGAVILNQLYKYTQLQDTCAVNMIALVNGEPKLLGLKEILEHYIKHQENVVRRRTEYDLEKTRARVHILEGLKIAIDNIDEVIKTIRASASVAEARDALVVRFNLTQVQAQAIVDMTLGKLSGLERIKVEEELAAKLALIKELEEILANESKLLEIISNELLEIKEKFADGRRTEIAGAIDDIIDEDLIEKEECVVTITRDGYIKRSSASVYSAQRRGGKGIRGMKTKEEDFVDDIIVVHSHSYLLMFTDSGKVFMKKVYQIPESSNISKGTNLVNLINLEKGEKVTSVIAIKSFEDNEYFVMVTKYGVVKRANVKDFEFQRKGGKIAMNLDEGDKLEFVKHTTGENDIIIATREGKAVRFQEKEARVMGRTARGVRGIKLKGDDYVVGVAVVDEEKMLITVTEKGYGKRNGFDGYTAHSRGTTGVLCHKLTDKTGNLAGIATVSEDDDIMIITNEGILIRMPVSDVNVYDGNSTVGVRVMRLNENAVIVNFAATKSEDKEEEEINAAIEESEKESISSLEGASASSVVDEDEI